TMSKRDWSSDVCSSEFFGILSIWLLLCRSWLLDRANGTFLYVGFIRHKLIASIFGMLLICRRRHGGKIESFQPCVQTKEFVLLIVEFSPQFFNGAHVVPASEFYDDLAGLLN